MTELAYVNGGFCELADAKVSVEDRGYQFGDGVYEVIVAYNGKLFLADEHMARLVRSCRAVEIPFDFAACSLLDLMQEGLSRAELTDAMIYIQITRGVASRMHAIPAGMKPSLVMTFKPRPVIPEELRQRGVRVMTTPETRWANCYVKAVTLLPNVLARLEANRKGFDDAVFVTGDGEVRECTAANVFAVRDGSLNMPPLTNAILHGITQKFLLSCAEGIGVPTRHQSLRIDAFRSADEAFMSSTVGEVLGITSIDRTPVGSGTVGPITKRLYAEFMRRVGRG